jgi:hypothetical protein
LPDNVIRDASVIASRLMAHRLRVNHWKKCFIRDATWYRKPKKASIYSLMGIDIMNQNERNLRIRADVQQLFDYMTAQLGTVAKEYGVELSVSGTTGERIEVGIDTRATGKLGISDFEIQCFGEVSPLEKSPDRAEVSIRFKDPNDHYNAFSPGWTVTAKPGECENEKRKFETRLREFVGRLVVGPYTSFNLSLPRVETEILGLYREARGLTSPAQALVTLLKELAEPSREHTKALDEVRWRYTAQKTAAPD